MKPALKNTVMPLAGNEKPLITRNLAGSTFDGSATTAGGVTTAAGSGVGADGAAGTTGRAAGGVICTEGGFSEGGLGGVMSGKTGVSEEDIWKFPFI